MVLYKYNFFIEDTDICSPNVKAVPSDIGCFNILPVFPCNPRMHCEKFSVKCYSGQMR